MIELRSHPEGTILPIRARPGARKNEIRGEQDGMLKVSLTQSPEKGKANKALIALLAEKLSLRKSQLELIAGQTSQQKQVLVRNVTPGELSQLVEQRLPQ